MFGPFPVMSLMLADQKEQVGSLFRYFNMSILLGCADRPINTWLQNPSQTVFEKGQNTCESSQSVRLGEKLS